MQKVRGINGSALKVIAMVSMVFDHGAAVLLGLLLIKNGIYDVGNLSPDYMRELLALGSPGYLYIAYQIMRRVVGRIAFPIYCFLLVEGFQRTKNRKKYMLRLFLFALISEIPFDLAFHGTLFEWDYNNVFFTLLIAFVMMYLWDVIDKKDLGPVRRFCMSVFLSLRQPLGKGFTVIMAHAGLSRWLLSICSGETGWSRSLRAAWPFCGRLRRLWLLSRSPFTTEKRAGI